MTRPLDEHLDDAEIEGILLSWGDNLGDLDSLWKQSSEQDSGEAARHLEFCEDCSRKVRMHRDMQDVLRRLAGSRRIGPDSRCPKNIDWTGVAAGLLPAKECSTLLAHAAICSRCGYYLSEAAQGLSNEASPEEDALLESLSSVDPAWHVAMAKQMSEAAQPPVDRRLWRSIVALKPQLVLAAAALALLILAGWIAFRTFRTPSPRELLAEAYSEHRTLELRIPGAKNTPIHKERGAGTSNLDKPAALLRAESIIGEGLRKNPNDVGLLDAKARADLIDGNYESAIKSLLRALETQSDSIPLMTDLATAYVLRADATDEAIDYGRAIQYLGKVLARSPNDGVALFNRAIAEERVYLYNDAIADWKKFLQVETDPGWLNEGKRRLEELLHKMEERDHSNVLPFHDPLEAVAALHSHAMSPREKNWPQSLDEGYLHVASAEWFQEISPPYSRGSRDQQRDASDAWAALNALSDTLRRQHDDDWLFDLIKGAHTSAWAGGVRELSAAVRANSEGDTIGTISHAKASLKLFHSTGNRAGEAGARFEYASGLNRSEMGNRCLPAALGGLRQTRHHRYPWLETNLLYEVSTCYFLNGNPEAAAHFAQRGARLASMAGYGVLRLDGLYFLDGVTTSWVASSESWNRIRLGLRDFWQSGYPPLSGAQFYGDLGFAAETEEMWYFAEAAGRESVLMRSTGDDRLNQAAAHHWLAQVAEAADDASLADAEYEKASEALASRSKDSRAARVTLEIERASLEIRQNKLQNAALRLDKIEPQLDAVNKQYARITYLESSGELHLLSGKPKLAEAELLGAMQLIETNKHSLSSELDLLTWQRDSSRVYRSLLEIYCLTDHDDARSLAFLEWYRAGALRAYSRHLHQQSASPSEIGLRDLSFSAYLPKRLKLAARTAVITWASLPTGLAVWLLDSDGVHFAWVHVTPSTLRNTVNRFTRLCADPSSDISRLDADARQLYEWLFQPLASDLFNSVSLVIEPDDFLDALPFQVLKSPDGKYLGDRFSIVESPGVGYSRLLRSDHGVSATSTVLAVGNPVPSAANNMGLSPLPEADEEARDISAKFDHHQLLTGRHATVANVIKFLPQAEVFHFAGHSISRRRDPGLLLTVDDSRSDDTALLGHSQLQPKRLAHLRLAILSACETGIVDQGLTDPGSLVKLFLVAGVPQVIASKWRVDSVVSFEIMDGLYTHLLEGDSVDSALSFSERAIRSRPETSHPYYWAAFSEFGGN